MWLNSLQWRFANQGQKVAGDERFANHNSWVTKLRVLQGMLSVTICASKMTLIAAKDYRPNFFILLKL
jgi:hypothetical protein